MTRDLGTYKLMIMSSSGGGCGFTIFVSYFHSKCPLAVDVQLDVRPQPASPSVPHSPPASHLLRGEVWPYCGNLFRHTLDCDE
jgi:hypothetical protein